MIKIRTLLAYVCMILLISLIFSCGYAEDNSNESIDTVNFEKFGITMRIPNTWKVEIEDENFVGFSEYDGDGKISTMYGISCTSIEEYGTLSEYLKVYEDNLNTYEYIEQINLSEIEIDKAEAHMFTYVDKSISKKAKCKSVILLKKSNIIELTFYSENENAQEVFNYIIDYMVIE